MDGLQEMLSFIATYGAGIVALALFLVLGFVIAKKLPNLLAAWQRDQATATEVIRANSDAIKEMAKSNVNVAHALSMLQPLIERSVETQDAILSKQDKVLSEVLIIGERTRDCGKKGV